MLIKRRRIILLNLLIILLILHVFVYLIRKSSIFDWWQYFVRFLFLLYIKWYFIVFQRNNNYNLLFNFYLWLLGLFRARFWFRILLCFFLNLIFSLCLFFYLKFVSQNLFFGLFNLLNKFNIHNFLIFSFLHLLLSIFRSNLRIELSLFDFGFYDIMGRLIRWEFLNLELM